LFSTTIRGKKDESIERQGGFHKISDTGKWERVAVVRGETIESEKKS